MSKSKDGSVLQRSDKNTVEGDQTQNVLIVGMGQLGEALFNLIDRTAKYDLQCLDKTDKEKIRKPIDLMHICFPFNRNFVKATIEYMKHFKPQLTLIESTVKPETTQKIFAQTKMPICHSPVRGCHSEGLENGLRTYTKFIGPAKHEYGLIAERYYNSLGIKTLVCSSQLETEYMKILETSYSALMIAYFQEIRRICEKQGLNENEIKHFFLTNTTESNYRHMRPVCFPGIIGGHCLLSNLFLLKEAYPMKFIDFILESNEKRKQELE